MGDIAAIIAGSVVAGVALLFLLAYAFVKAIRKSSSSDVERIVSLQGPVQGPVLRPGMMLLLENEQEPAPRILVNTSPELAERRPRQASQNEIKAAKSFAKRALFTQHSRSGSSDPDPADNPAIVGMKTLELLEKRGLTATATNLTSRRKSRSRRSR